MATYFALWSVAYLQSSWSHRFVETPVAPSLLEDESAHCWHGIHVAAQEGDVELVLKFLQEGVPVDTRTCWKATPDEEEVQMTSLHIAAKYGETEMMKVLLEAHAEKEALTAGEYTPLALAAHYGQVGAIKLLIDAGATVDMKNGKYEKTALMVATYENRSAAVQTLLECNASVNEQGDYDESALWLASDSCNVGIVKMLLDHGAQPNSFNMDHETPLYRAAGCNMNGRNPKDQGAVMEALIEKRAWKNVKNQNGDTALHHAAANCNPEAIRILLKHKAKIRLNRNLQDPYDLAYGECAALLKDKN